MCQAHSDHQRLSQLDFAWLDSLCAKLLASLDGSPLSSTEDVLVVVIVSKILLGICRDTS
jgi:hypothetical protein